MVVLTAGLILLPSTSASAASEADLSIDKSVTGGTTHAPGSTFSYVVGLQCSSLIGGCVNATFVDDLPAPLVFDPAFTNPVTAQVPNNGTTAVTIAGTKATVKFTKNIGDGELGLEAGQQATITLRVKVPDAPSADYAGTITNVGTVSADNADTKTDDAAITLNITSHLEAAVTKERDTPAIIASIPGTSVDFTLDGRNTSNQSVTSLTMQDPIDPAAASNPFTSLQVTGLGAFTPPGGAEKVTVEWATAAGVWATSYDGLLPGSTSGLLPADKAAIYGLRFTFASTTGTKIPIAGKAVIGLETVTRTSVTSIGSGASLTLTNDVRAWVTDGGTDSPQVNDNADVKISNVPPTVQTTKEFDKDDLIGNETAVATIRTDNQAMPVHTMTITEPGSGATDDFAAQGLLFEGFKASAIEWPTGATSVSVTYHYAGVADAPKVSAVVDTLPAPTGNVEDVTGFEITFTATGNGIEPYAYAVIPFSVKSAAVSGNSTVTAVNTTTSTVTDTLARSDSDDATDSIDRLPVRIATTVSKSFTPTKLYAAVGSTTIVNLTAAVSPRPDSTVGSQYLEISDPATDGGSASFWSCFQVKKITDTAIPAGTTLTVQKWNGSAWENLTAPVSGSVASWSYTIPAADRAAIEGIRFRFTPNSGTLAPGFNVAPNFAVSVRDGAACLSEPADAVIDNQVRSEVANVPVGLPPVTTSADDEVTVKPLSGTGPDMVDKTWLDPDDGSETDLVTVGALSDETRVANLKWSTQGFAFDSVTITDPATDAETTDITTSIYNAFNLTHILPITVAQDPQIAEDKVSKVEVYSTTAPAGWKNITTAACAVPANCIGTFAGYTIPAADLDSVVGVRLTFVSRETGEPVASSVGNNRVVRLGYTVRDRLRSDSATYVLGQHHLTHTYNTGDPGIVRNTVRMEGTTGSFTRSTDDHADVVIIDRPLNIELTKSNEYGPLGLPPVGTPAAEYPILDTTLEATNTTTSKVTALRIQDPKPATPLAASAFDTLNLYDIRSITLPAGAVAADLSFTVALNSGGPETWTYQQALDKTSAELADVIGIDVTLAKEWLNPENKLIVALSFQLRSTERASGDPMTTTTGGSAPIHENTALATVSGPGGTGVSCSTAAPGVPCDTVEAEATASFQVLNPSYEVKATKAISVTSRYEDESASGYVVTLTGQPIGTARTTLLTLTDDDPRFWNAFDLDSIGALSVAGPVNAYRVSYLASGPDGTLTHDYVTGTDTLSYRCDGAVDLTDCWRTGGWVAAASGTITPATVVGLAMSTVRGVKIEAKRVASPPDASSASLQWERPNNQKVTVKLNVIRRANLVTGKTAGTVPVPSTLPGMALAPGEPTQGTIHNQLDVDGVASWGNPNVADPKWSDSDSAEATTQLRHRINKIRVTKGPGQGISTAVPLYENGYAVPYEMTVINSGDYTMSGPSFTLVDRIGLYSGDNTLPVETPDADDFVYALKDAGGLPAPMTAPTPTIDAATGTISFAFPSGFSFPPGYTLTVAVGLTVKSTLPAGTEIVNAVTASADRQFEECRWTRDLLDQTATGSASAPVDDCTADTTIEVHSNVPLGMVKRVRGVESGLTGVPTTDDNYDDLGVLADSKTNTTDCEVGGAGAADAEGFYAWPCVPITRPGGTEEWKIDFANGGNTNASVVAGIDVLPAVGDTGVRLPASRDSKFAVRLLNEFSSNLSLLTYGTDATLSIYTMNTVPPRTCNEADILHSTTPGGLATSNACYAEIPLRDWTLVTPGADLSAARAFKFVLTFGDPTSATETKGLKPNEHFTMTYQTTTPTYPDLATAQAAGLAIAWNSVAAGSRATAAGSQPAAPSMVSEPPKAGVAMPTGQLMLAKTVSAPTWSRPITLPSAYDFDLSCTSAGTTVPLTGTLGTEDRSTVSVPVVGGLTYNSGTPASNQVNLPWGAECTATETGQPTGDVVTYNPTNKTMTAVRDLSGYANIMHAMPAQSTSGASLTTTNTYSAGGFTVTKTVDNGGAVDQDGDPIAYGPFTFTASCLYLGQQAIPATELTFTLAAGASKTFSDLPTGAACTVTETGRDGAARTAYQVTTDGTVGTATTGTSTSFTILEGASPKVSAAFTNTYDVGSLTVTKAIAGAGAADWGTTDFTLHARCTLDGDVVYDGDSPVINSSNLEWTIASLATGASCVVTEPKQGGANSTSFDPTSATVTISTGTETVDVTNTFTLGAVTVEKVLAGPAATDPGAVNGDYTMEITCTRDVNGATVAVTIPGGARQTIHGEGDATWTGLPTGARCEVAEVDSVPATDDVVVSPSSVVVPAGLGTPVDVVVTNSFHDGSISLSKALAGPSRQFAPADFQVTVTCEFPVGTTVALPSGGLVTLSADGTPVTLSAIPTGAVCDAEEADAGQTSVDFSPTTLTVGKATTVAMTVTNTYASGALQIVKDLAGVGASVARGPFDFTVDCTFNGQAVPLATVTLSPTSGATRLTSDPVTDLPVGAECTVTETAGGNAITTGAPVVVTITDGSATTPVSAAFVNSFGAGTVRVAKIGKGKFAKDSILKTKPVTIRVTCEYTTGVDVATVLNQNLQVLVGRTETVRDAAGVPIKVPVGSVCWVDELDSLGASLVEIEHGTSATGLTVAATTSSATGVLSFAVTNTYRTPPTGSVSNLSDERGGSGPGGGVGGNGGVADTGSAVNGWLVGLMGLMLVAGAGLVVAARRRV